MVDQTKIIGTRQRVLAGSWKSLSSHIKLLHGSCILHSAIEGSHLLVIPDQTGTNDMEYGRLGVGSHASG